MANPLLLQGVSVRSRFKCNPTSAKCPGALKISFFCLMVLVWLQPIAALADIQLPRLGDPVSAIVSPNDEIILGRAYLRALRSRMPIIQDPPLNEYIRQLTTQIIAASNSEIPPIRIILINASSINAFAVPGGVLGINAGLFLYTTSEAELAAVVAHELAHLSQRHYARGIEHREKTKWATFAGLLASIALLATSESSTGIAGILATQAITLDAHLQFSRQNEREADRIGMETLHSAGFDPRAMPAFFGRLLQSTQFSGNENYEFLNTHPVTQSRISDSLARADQLTFNSTSSRPTGHFSFMQARVKAAYASTPQEAVAQFKSKLRKNPNNKIFRYGLARAYIRNQQFEQALTTIRNQGTLRHAPLELDNDTLLEFGLVEIEALLEQEAFAAALQTCLTLLDRYPRHVALRYYRSQAELGLRQDKAAIAILEELLQADAENLLYLDSLLIAHRRQLNQVSTLMTQAQISFAQGQYTKAKKHYEQALKSVTKNLPLRGKLEHQIREIDLLELKLRQFSQ